MRDRAAAELPPGAKGTLFVVPGQRVAEEMVWKKGPPHLGMPMAGDLAIHREFRDAGRALSEGNDFSVGHGKPLRLSGRP